MANTYADAVGVLLFDGIARITPVIRMFFTRFCLDDTPEASGTEHYVAVLSEENRCDWDSYIDEIVEAAERDFRIDFQGRTTLLEVIETLGKHFDADPHWPLPSIDFEGSVELKDLVNIALLLRDGHNLRGLCLQGCWHCDKPRLWEFGGWSSYRSLRYQLEMSTADVSAFSRKMDAAVARGAAPAANVLGSFVEEMIDGIVDVALRSEVARQLARQIDPPISVDPKKPPMPSSMPRFVAYELVPMALFDDGEPVAHRSMTDARLASDSTHWSLHGIGPDGQVFRVGNHCNYDWCAEIYARITGCIVPENPDGLRLSRLAVAE